MLGTYYLQRFCYVIKSIDNTYDSTNISQFSKKLINNVLCHYTLGLNH